MIHIYNRRLTEIDLSNVFNQELRSLIVDRLSPSPLLGIDLANHTEILVIENGDTEEEIISTIGFTPMVEPIDSIRFPEPAFQPFWDAIIRHAEYFEILVTFGSSYALIIFVERSMKCLQEIVLLCEHFSKQPNLL